MMAEVARGGEKRGFAIFVAAIAGQRSGLGERFVDERPILRVEREGKDLKVVVRMPPFAEPRADDHRGDRRLFERPARRDVGDRNAFAPRDAVERRKNRLQGRPAAGGVDEALVLHLAPVVDLVARRLRAPKPSLGEKASGERSVGEQAHAVFEAKRAHLARRPAVEKRKADLVGDDLDAVLHDDAQVRRVEIRDPEMADQPFAPELVELLHRVEIGEMLEAPPMELEEIDRRHAKAPQAALDAGAHDFRRHRAGRRAPFGEGDGPMRAGSFAPGDASQKPSRDQFRAAVVVGHVEGVEARSGVFEHGRTKPPPGRAARRRAPYRRPARGRSRCG